MLGILILGEVALGKADLELVIVERRKVRIGLLFLNKKNNGRLGHIGNGIKM